MSFKIFIHILRNTLNKRKSDIILPNYPNQLFVYFSLKKINTFGSTLSSPYYKNKNQKTSKTMQ